MTPDLSSKRLPLKDYKYLRSKGYSDEQIAGDGYELPKLKNRTVGDDAAGAGLAALHGASMGFADDVVGMVSPDLQDRMNRSREAFGEVHPIGEFGAELAGGAITGGALASGIKRTAARALPGVLETVTGGKVLGPVRVPLSVESGIMGGTAAAGASEGDLADRAKAFAIGAPTGAVAGPLIAKGVEKGVVPAYNAIARRVADSPIGTAVQTMAEKITSPRAQSFAERMAEIAGRRQARLTPEGRANAYVSRMMEQDQLSPQLVQQQIGGAVTDDPRMLFNLGGKNTQLATKVTQAIPSTATDEVPRRLLAQNQGGLDRVETALEKAVGVPLRDYQTRYGELAQNAVEAADPAYTAIRNTVIDYQKPLGEIADLEKRRATMAVRNVLNRPAGRGAYEQAKKNILNMGEDHPAVQAWAVEIDPHAGVGVQVPDGKRSAVTVGMMQDMKVVLDEQIAAIEDAIKSGALQGEQRARYTSELPGIKKVRNDLVGAVDVLTDGAYAEARRTAQPFLQAREAFREGYQSPFGSEGNVLNAAGRMEAPDRFAEGYATRLRDRARAARESQAGWADFTSQLFDSEAARRKMELAIPDRQLGPALLNERTLREQANNALVPRGSQTTPLAMGVADAVGGNVPQAIGGAMQAASAPLRTGARLGARALWDRFGGGLNTEAAGNAGDLLTRQLAAADPRLQSLLEFWLQQQADQQAAQTLGQRVAPWASTPVTRRIGGR